MLCIACVMLYCVLLFYFQVVVLGLTLFAMQTKASFKSFIF